MTEQPPRVAVTVIHQGQRYRVERRPDPTGGPGATVEYWPGRGVIGSYRRWLGHRHTTALTWYAAVNPTGQPGQASASTDRLPSRRAAIRWLLTRTSHLSGGR